MPRVILYCLSNEWIPIARDAGTNLELSMALEEQHVNGGELANVAVLLELLADLGADGGYGHVQRVHGLDLGGLWAYNQVSLTGIIGYSRHSWFLESISTTSLVYLKVSRDQIKWLFKT
jgi:hypothetical protein